MFTISKIKQMTLVSLFAALIAVGAFIKIPIPNIPFTLQTLFVLLSGILLGPKLGCVSAVCYMALGLCGLPVFTGGGGPAYVLYPTFGYIIGFAVGAYAAGSIAWRTPGAGFWRLLLAAVAGLLVIYAFGVVYYWLIYRFYFDTAVGFRTLIVTCFLLTLPGDLVLCCIAAALGKRLAPIVRVK